MKKLFLSAAAFAIISASFSSITYAREQAGHHAPAQEAITANVQKLSDHVYMIQAKGGNVALSYGKSGLFLIDAGLVEATPAILEAVKNIADEPVRFVVNTHWHADHTGGNEMLAHEGSLIVAHDHVRARLSEDRYIPAFDSTVKALPEAARPLITYTDETKFHINGDAVRVFHVENAHTDGDSIIHFPADNIIHTGDIYFNGFYPFIDAASGGRLDGTIAAADIVLGMADENTKIIPGHGPLSDKAQLQAYRDMLSGVRDALAPMIAQGKSLEEIAQENPLAPYNEEWGDGFLPPEKWLKVVYDAMKAS